MYLVIGISSFKLSFPSSFIFSKTMFWFPGLLSLISLIISSILSKTLLINNSSHGPFSWNIFLSSLIPLKTQISLFNS